MVTPTALTEAMLRITQLENVLQQIASRGTHHDQTPTRVIYFNNEQAMKIDDWWQTYFLRADAQVRKIAKDGLSMNNMFTLPPS